MAMMQNGSRFGQRLKLSLPHLSSSKSSKPIAALAHTCPMSPGDTSTVSSISYLESDYGDSYGDGAEEQGVEAFVTAMSTSSAPSSSSGTSQPSSPHSPTSAIDVCLILPPSFPTSSSPSASRTGIARGVDDDDDDGIIREEVEEEEDGGGDGRDDDIKKKQQQLHPRLRQRPLPASSRTVYYKQLAEFQPKIVVDSTPRAAGAADDEGSVLTKDSLRKSASVFDDDIDEFDGGAHGALQLPLEDGSATGKPSSSNGAVAGDNASLEMEWSDDDDESDAWSWSACSCHEPLGLSFLLDYEDENNAESSSKADMEAKKWAVATAPSSSACEV